MSMFGSVMRKSLVSLSPPKSSQSRHVINAYMFIWKSLDTIHRLMCSFRILWPDIRSLGCQLLVGR